MADIFDMENPISEFHSMMLMTRAMIVMLKGESSDIEKQTRYLRMQTRIEDMIRKHVRSRELVYKEDDDYAVLSEPNFYGAGSMAANLIRSMKQRVQLRVKGWTALKGNQYAWAPESATRVQYLLAWGTGRFTHIQVNGQECLIPGYETDVSNFTPNYHREDFFKLLGFDDGEPEFIDLEINTRMYETLKTGAIGIDLPSMAIGGRIAFEWEGNLDVLVMISAVISDGH